LLTSDGSSVGFFRRGLTLASFRELGKQPVEREPLIRWVRKVRRSGAIAWRMGDGTGSRARWSVGRRSPS